MKAEPRSNEFIAEFKTFLVSCSFSCGFVRFVVCFMKAEPQNTRNTRRSTTLQTYKYTKHTKEHGITNIQPYESHEPNPQSTIQNGTDHTNQFTLKNGCIRWS